MLQRSADIEMQNSRLERDDVGQVEKPVVVTGAPQQQKVGEPIPRHEFIIY